MGKENKNSLDIKPDLINESNTFQMFLNTNFEFIKAGCKITLRDKSSDAKSSLPVIIREDSYLAQPDGVIISNTVQNQRKCDYLIFVPSSEQTDFIELKGTNISSKKAGSPHNQILQTIDYFEKDKNLKELVNGKEKHAFIVSPQKQNIPAGIESEERKLYQKLTKNSKGKKYELKDLIHYVRVVPKGNYSCKDMQIICDTANGVPIPF